MKDNKKGFTLIELLAVIVILGVIMVIAVPAVTSYITHSKKEAFVNSALAFIDEVKTKTIDETYYKLPVKKNDVTVVSVSMTDLAKGKKDTSPYGSPWIANKTYILVINVGNSIDPKYEYYFAGQDSKNNAIPLLRADKIKSSSVIYNARNTMEVTIQSLAGTEDGTLEEHDTISGLTKAVPESWQATIYSKR